MLLKRGALEQKWSDQREELFQWTQWGVDPSMEMEGMKEMGGSLKDGGKNTLCTLCNAELVEFG